MGHITKKSFRKTPKAFREHILKVAESQSLPKAIFSFHQGSAFGKETALAKQLQIGKVGRPDNDKSAPDLKESRVKRHH